MKLRRVSTGGQPIVQIGAGDGWVDTAVALSSLRGELAADDIVCWSSDAVALLGAPADVLGRINEAARSLPPSGEPQSVHLPFEPKSFRDFMLYERHAIDAARGFVQRFMPGVLPIVRAYEAVLGAPFPALKPHALWYRQPIYYMGNHLAFVTDGEAVAIPSYTDALDYELELGFVLAHELFNASPDDAERAIGGFVVVNDFSARDVQRAEMRSGFGPQKAKHFRNGISAVVVSADEILPRWRDLKGSVRINGQLISEPSSAGAQWSLGEALAHASRAERLYPGEFFATGTLPGGSGIETGRLLTSGDTIELAIEGVGSLTNLIAAKDSTP
ncbi:fumarylacetoacetate hydrolase family protein [Hyphomicrobium sp.]|uniref:fumarylacetoacetate hydrolase family protein n=1 Tax=Hyphomicrobium sp. TaxID=82 RepID=UPI002E342035|nr:fumarylacetoacetate hydrolase family protein [Hyphomicrobium sp.]HEX2841050.1 fumarylacetoacetate hydrolase family protein [Hyphomicrobium sp.]